MNPSSSLSSRRLLQVVEAGGAINPIIITGSAPTAAVTIPWSSSSAKPFDSSIALTIFVLFSALLFLGFIYAYIKRYISPNAGSVDGAESEVGAENSKSRGLSASAVSSLPMVAYGKAGLRRMTLDECTICLCDFDEKETIKIIPHCGHVFHPRCIDMWLVYHVTCPICRSDKLFGSAEEEEVRLDVTHDRSGAVAA